ncbi:hypothetical protein ACHWP0_09850 [Weissella cibaria]|uniref:hypothetical protein n=1 Tax=Weissella cibaria TaxID=137591 RepID=UPI00376EF702
MIRYSPEFKQSLVEMHNQGRSYTELPLNTGLRPIQSVTGSNCTQSTKWTAKNGRKLM